MANSVGTKCSLLVAICKDIGENTDLTMVLTDSLEKEIKEVKAKEIRVEKDCDELEKRQVLRLSNIQNDEYRVKFDIGFSTISALMVCFNFLWPSVNKLNYRLGSSQETQVKTTEGKRRKLSPFKTLPAGNNLGWICPQRKIIESCVTAYRVFFLRLLYLARACNLLVSSVKMNVSLPINQWHFH